MALWTWQPSNRWYSVRDSTHRRLTLYLAAIHGKVPTELARMEDFVTSNVFGFLKYSARKVYLASVLRLLDIPATRHDLEAAEFEPWPVYPDNTEPDLVLRIGGRYVLFEAKWLSPFGCATEKTDEQIVRELRGGQAIAVHEGRDFLFVAVTQDFRHEAQVREAAPADQRDRIRWLRWGDIAGVIQEVLATPDAPDRGMAEDLIAVMARYRLLLFRGFDHIDPPDIARRNCPLFLKSSKYRFSGFRNLPSPNLQSIPRRSR